MFGYPEQQQKGAQITRETTVHHFNFFFYQRLIGQICNNKLWCTLSKFVLFASA